MNTNTTRLGVIALIVVSVAAVVAVPAVAQSDSAGNSSAVTNGGENATTVVAQVDDRLRVTDYSYSEESELFSVTLENTADRYGSTVTVTEAIEAEGSGAGTFGIERVDLSPGETITVEVSVSADGLRGVMITSERSIENGQGTYLSAESDGGGELIKGGATGADVRSSGVFALIGSCLFALFGAWLYVSVRNEEVREVSTTPERTLLGRFRDD